MPREVIFAVDLAQVTLEDTVLFDPLFGCIAKRAETRRATPAVHVIRLGITDVATARLFTATSIEAVFAEGLSRYICRWHRAGDVAGWSYVHPEATTASTASGLLTAFASGQLRHTDAGIRIEPVSNNGVRPGKDFTAALWTKTGVALALQRAAHLPPLTSLL